METRRRSGRLKAIAEAKDVPANGSQQKKVKTAPKKKAPAKKPTRQNQKDNDENHVEEGAGTEMAPQANKTRRTRRANAGPQVPREAPDSPEMDIGDDKPQVSPPPSRPESSNSNGRPRRSITAQKVVYTAPKHEDDMISMSSSSSSAESSESENEEIVIEKKAMMKPAKNQLKRKSSSPGKGGKNKRSEKLMLSSSSSDEYDSDSDVSDVEPEAGKTFRQKSKPNNRKVQMKASRKKTGKEPDVGDANWPKCRPASIARKTGNPAGSKSVKSGLRMATKQKPDQPWKKNIQGYEADRKMAKGERRMKEYRNVAEFCAKGKIGEVSYDECYKIHEDMKAAYKQGLKIIEAVQKQEKKEATVSSQDGDSSSEDEWEEAEEFHPILDDKIEVEMNPDDDGEEGVEKDWWVVYLRQEINKRIRTNWENTHKVHLLCYMAHLKHVVKTALDESLIPSMTVSQLPTGYLKYIGETVIPVDVMTKLVKWYSDAFRPLNGIISVTAIQEELKEGHEARFPATSRLTALVSSKCYETDLDRATLLFCLLRGLELTSRVCVNVRAIQRKWDSEQQAQLQKEMDKFKESRSNSPGGKNVEKVEEVDDGEGTSDGKVKKKKKTISKSKGKEERNYWVEYWEPREKRWICIDPLHKTVDEPLTIHEDATLPMSYVFAIDNKQGICEVTQRYAMDCVKQDFRRRRTDPKWIFWTLSLPYFAANAQRKKLEQMQMRQDLVARPLPTTMSEYKNHPLYVLEKDLLKFEAIYPPPKKQKPLGQIRGHNVYPRSTVFTLQGENNWLKLARSVKVGEEPYKVVKARPDPRIPVEERVDQFLNVYGYWQTEKYRRPPLKNGKIPCNEYGNVYMFNENMCPLECVHLKLTGLVQISRKLNKQCVPAVVGWAFDGGWTHPVMDGAIVLKKDAAIFQKEWEKLEQGRAEREEAKYQERVYSNWKKLIKGMLRLQYVRKKFAKEKPEISKDLIAEDVEMETVHASSDQVIDNSSAIKPLDGFSLDDFINNKK